MNKPELISKISEKTEVEKNAVEKVINALIEVVTETLKDGGEVVLTGFGTFSARQRAARIGVNPRTAEKIQIAAVKVPKFKAGKSLKDALRK